MKKTTGMIAIAAFSLVLVVGAVTAQEIATLREGTPIPEQAKPDPIPQTVNNDIKEQRNYPMQPPVIPHDTRGYEVNLNANRCMSCHSRKRTAESQATMISVTHYMDRDGNFLAEVSPRRYFCNQCHVNQTVTRKVIENDFKDMDQLLEQRAADGRTD